MLIQKTNPVGIDEIIDAIQLKLNASTILSAGTWNNYPRAYKNPKASEKTGYIPEIYDENGEYIEAFMDDKVTLSTFFVTDDSRDYLSTQLTSKFSLIVQCSDLKVLFPSITHRGDEELIHKFLSVLKMIPGITVLNIKTGISEVYREFDRSRLKLDNMGALFVFRVDMSANYGIACCTDC